MVVCPKKQNFTLINRPGHSWIQILAKNNLSILSGKTIGEAEFNLNNLNRGSDQSEWPVWQNFDFGGKNSINFFKPSEWSSVLEVLLKVREEISTKNF